MARILVTTFQKAGHNLAEAQNFKKGALASKLLCDDRVNELWPAPEKLKQKGNVPGILEVGSSPDDRLFGLLQLSTSRGAGWRRLNKDHKAEFDAFLASLYAKPIDCWVIGGHHHWAPDTYRVMTWGTQFKIGDLYRPYVGFGIDKTSGEIEWFGFREKVAEPRDIVLPGASARVKTVSLMLVLGCNGIPRKADGVDLFVHMAEAWRALTKPALILGWFGVHGMPLDSEGKNASPHFWRRMKALKATHGIPDDGLPALVANHGDKVIQAWGEACYEAFAASGQKDLWHLKVGGLPFPDAKGAGAVARDGKVFHANPAYTPTNGKAAMTDAGVTVP